LYSVANLKKKIVLTKESAVRHEIARSLKLTENLQQLNKLKIANS